jgi:hypothetical protein
MDKIHRTRNVLQGIQEELCRYNPELGLLAPEIASYLETANDFREILDNFVYVNLWFYGALSNNTELLGLAHNYTTNPPMTDGESDESPEGR